MFGGTDETERKLSWGPPSQEYWEPSVRGDPLRGEAFARGAANALTLNAFDPAAATIMSAFDPETTYEESLESQREAKRAYPGTHLVGELATAWVPGSMAMKGINAARIGIPRTAAEIAVGAGEGAVVGALGEDTNPLLGATLGAASVPVAMGAKKLFNMALPHSAEDEAVERVRDIVKGRKAAGVEPDDILTGREGATLADTGPEFQQTIEEAQKYSHPGVTQMRKTFSDRKAGQLDRIKSSLDNIYTRILDLDIGDDLETATSDLIRLSQKQRGTPRAEAFLLGRSALGSGQKVKTRADLQAAFEDLKDGVNNPEEITAAFNLGTRDALISTISKGQDQRIATRGLLKPSVQDKLKFALDQTGDSNAYDELIQELEVEDIFDTTYRASIRGGSPDESIRPEMSRVQDVSRTIFVMNEVRRLIVSSNNREKNRQILGHMSMKLIQENPLLPETTQELIESMPSTFLAPAFADLGLNPDDTYDEMP